MLGALLEDPAVVEKVRTMPSVALHRMVAYLGMEDSAELLAMATPEQMREVLDLELWHGDRMRADEALDWLHFMTTFPDEVRPKNFQALDVELVGCILQRHMHIYLAERDEIPQEPEGVFHRTPDGWFILDIVADHETTVERVIQLVDALYDDDPEGSRRLLQNLMWELPSDLEEWSYRWRIGRLMDLGFSDPQEALLIYAYLAPVSVNAEESTTDKPLASDPEPAPHTSAMIESRFDSTSFWSKAAGLIDRPEEQQRLSQALLHLCNRALTADRISPADLEAAEQSLEHLHWRLSLGLEYLCQGDLGRSRSILSGIALLRIARVGFSLTLDLRRRIITNVRRGQLGRTPGSIDLLDAPLCHQIAALLKPRPLFHDMETGSSRPFQTLADLSLASQWIDQALASAIIASRLDLPSPLPDGVTFGDMFRTSVVNGLLGREGPLDQGSLVRFLSEFVSGDRLAPAVAAAALARVADSPREKALANRWVDHLEQAVAPLSTEDPDLRFIDSLWLKR